MLRSKLPPGAPLRDAFQQPELLQEAGEEAKQALRQGLLLGTFGNLICVQVVVSL